MPQSATDVFNPLSLHESSHTLNSFTQDISYSAQHSQDSDMLLDALSEEVKSKPIPTKPDDYSRSYSSEAPSPARSLSSLSPNKDHHRSLSSYTETLHPASPLSDGPLLESASPS